MNSVALRRPRLRGEVFKSSLKPRPPHRLPRVLLLTGDCHQRQSRYIAEMGAGGQVVRVMRVGRRVTNTTVLPPGWIG